MLKKLLSLILALALVFTFMACDSKDRDYDDEDEEDSAVAENEDKETIIEKDDVITFEEQVVVDNENYTIIIKSIDPEGDWGYTLNAYFENKTNEDVEFFVDAACLNDVMCDPYFSTDVAAGKQCNDEISFFQEDLEECGIEKVTSITLTFSVCEAESWDERFATEATIYPYGADAHQSYERISTKDEIVVVDNNDCTMVILGVVEDSLWGYELQVYIHNKTASSLELYVDDTSINDIMIDGWGSVDTIAPGKHAYGNILWDEDDLVENGIEEVETIWMEIMLEDWDNYETVYETEIEFAPF